MKPRHLMTALNIQTLLHTFIVRSNNQIRDSFNFLQNLQSTEFSITQSENT